MRRAAVWSIEKSSYREPVRWRGTPLKCAHTVISLSPRTLRRRLLFAALLVATRGFALDPARAVTQARMSAWTTESGLPQGTIDAIVQTRDGYLWVGTEEGLV